MKASVSIATAGRVRVVGIDRPERRNAVDLPTARALIAAGGAVRWRRRGGCGRGDGAGGAFRAGGDLKALAEGERKPIELQCPAAKTRMRISATGGPLTY